VREKRRLKKKRRVSHKGVESQRSKKKREKTLDEMVVIPEQAEEQSSYGRLWGRQRVKEGYSGVDEFLIEGQSIPYFK